MKSATAFFLLMMATAIPKFDHGFWGDLGGPSVFTVTVTDKFAELILRLSYHVLISEPELSVART